MKNLKLSFLRSYTVPFAEALVKSLTMANRAREPERSALRLMSRRNGETMTKPVDIVRDFYAAIAAGDTATMVGLMASDIDWISVVDFDVQGRGPEEVMKKVFAPLMQEWESFSPNPSEFHAEGSTVVSLGRFACVHRATGKRADLPYAHVWDVRDGKIERHRQYIDTLALEQVRHSGAEGTPA